MNYASGYPSGHWWRRIHAEIIDLVAIFVLAGFIHKFFITIFQQAMPHLIMRSGIFLLTLYFYNMAILRFQSKASLGMRLLYLQFESVNEPSLQPAAFTTRWIIKYTPLWLLYAFETGVRFDLFPEQATTFMYAMAILITSMWTIALIFSPSKQAMHDRVSGIHVIDASRDRKINGIVQWVVRPALIAVIGMLLLGTGLVMLHLSDDPLSPEVEAILDEAPSLEKRFEGVYWLFGLRSENHGDILEKGKENYSAFQERFFHDQNVTIPELENIRQSVLDYRDLVCYLTLIPQTSDGPPSCATREDAKQLVEEHQHLISRYRHIFRLPPFFIQADVTYIYGPLTALHTLDLLDIWQRSESGEKEKAFDLWHEMMRYWIQSLQYSMGYTQTFLTISYIQQGLALLPVLLTRDRHIARNHSNAIFALLQSPSLQPRGWKWEQLVAGSVLNWSVAEQWFQPNLFYLPMASRNDLYHYLNHIWAFYYSFTPHDFIKTFLDRKLERPPIYKVEDLIYNASGKSYVGLLGHEHSDPHLLDAIYRTGLLARMVGLSTFLTMQRYHVPEGMSVWLEHQPQEWWNFAANAPFTWNQERNTIRAPLPGGKDESAIELVVGIPR